MVVIAGDIPTHYYGKHPHQEVNLHADAAQFEIYKPFVKRAWRVESPELFPEIIEKAFQLAESGQPGPVLVDVPMDIFSKEVDVERFDRLRHNTKTLAKPDLDVDVARRNRSRARRSQEARSSMSAAASCWRKPRTSCANSSTTWAFRWRTA